MAALGAAMASRSVSLRFRPCKITRSCSNCPLSLSNCLDEISYRRKVYDWLISSNSALSDAPNIFASDATVVSSYAPDEYERTMYYHGVTAHGDHPELIYRLLQT
ncbi:hypothetical protein C8Q76DRAFT_450271 [Earliella scabrosa]|nr:hypothetical protein C8Q76DRAFT_450271 [Earliella scabrosa]